MQALALIGNKHGVLIAQDGNGRFSPTEFRLRLKCTIMAPSATATAKIAEKRTGHPFPPGMPLTNDDIGKTYKSGSIEYRIEGYNPARPKRCVMLTRLRDNKTFIANPADVANALGRDVPAARRPNPPHVIGTYPGNWDMQPNEPFDAYDKRTDAMLQAIPADKVISFPRGDGRAMYYVVSVRPLKLQHIPYGDAWTADPMTLRGLRAVDVEAMIESNKKMREIFAKRRA
jgi:hypothetical protein